MSATSGLLDSDVQRWAKKVVPRLREMSASSLPDCCCLAKVVHLCTTPPCKLLGCYQATCIGGDAGAISNVVQAHITPDWLILSEQPRTLQRGEQHVGSDVIKLLMMTQVIQHKILPKNRTCSVFRGGTPCK